MRTVQGDHDLLQRGDSVDGIDELGIKSEDEDLISLLSNDDAIVRLVLNPSTLMSHVMRKTVFAILIRSLISAFVIGSIDKYNSCRFYNQNFKTLASF